MTTNVYHVHFLDHQLPDSPEEKARFAREYAERLTGEKQGEITAFMQQHRHDPGFRITIAVPRRLTRAVEKVQESGLEPVFTEPEAPFVDGHTCVIPSTFQITNFGVALDPRTVSNHPVRQNIIAETLAEHVPDFPEHARDLMNWTRMEQDKETGTVILYWNEPEKPEETK